MTYQAAEKLQGDDCRPEAYLFDGRAACALAVSECIKLGTTIGGVVNGEHTVSLDVCNKQVTTRAAGWSAF